ncbi:hypothetical protein H8356DRAFT_1347027, partial [Neocallimastix lanati (nom. inval.)]
MLSKDRYIVKCNDNKDTDISNIDYQHKIMFMLIDRLEIYEELIKLDLSETAQYIICNIE